jgi:hypothetical protein
VAAPLDHHSFRAAGRLDEPDDQGQGEAATATTTEKIGTYGHPVILPGRDLAHPFILAVLIGDGG